MEIPLYNPFYHYTIYIGKAGKITGLYKLKNVSNDECHSSNGYPCLFPFFYQGKSYNACTLLNYHKYWCGTSYDSNGEDFNWGICNTNCPIGGGFFLLFGFDT